jgi:hypothetical protein
LNKKLDRMEKVKFRVQSRYIDTQATPILMRHFNKQLRTQVVMFKNGVIEFRNATPDEEDFLDSIVLTQRMHIEGGHFRVYADFEYVPEHLEGKLNSEYERLNNIRNRKLHEFMKMDSRVKSTNNQNIIADPPFELVEVSADVIAEEKKNKEIATASQKLTEVYNNNEDLFVDICYAYGIPNIQNSEKQKLYNLCMSKLTINPQEFLKLINQKDIALRSLVQRAINFKELKDGQEKGIIDITPNGNYMLDGEFIAANIDDCYEHFKSHEKHRRYLETKLGVAPLVVHSTMVTKAAEDTTETVELTLVDHQISQRYAETNTRDIRFKLAQAWRIKDPIKREKRINTLREVYSNNSVNEKMFLKELARLQKRGVEMTPQLIDKKYLPINEDYVGKKKGNTEESELPEVSEVATDIDNPTEE